LNCVRNSAQQEATCVGSKQNALARPANTGGATATIFCAVVSFATAIIFDAVARLIVVFENRVRVDHHLERLAGK
jgi:hypothetical protein